MAWALPSTSGRYWCEVTPRWKVWIAVLIEPNSSVLVAGVQHAGCPLKPGPRKLLHAESKTQSLRFTQQRETCLATETWPVMSHATGMRTALHCTAASPGRVAGRCTRLPGQGSAVVVVVAASEVHGACLHACVALSSHTQPASGPKTDSSTTSSDMQPIRCILMMSTGAGACPVPCACLLCCVHLRSPSFKPFCMLLSC